MAIQGLRDTDNFVTNERPENWRQGLLLLYPNSAEAAKAPLTALPSLMKSRSVDDPIYHWWEKSLDDRRIQLNADVLAGDAALTVVAKAQTLKAGDVLMFEQTGEVVHVSSDPTLATSIAVVRGIGNAGVGLPVTFAGAGVNPYLLVIGSAFEEGSLAPTGINFDPTERSNYTQIFRSTLEITRTASKTRLRTTDAVKEAKRECLEYVSVDMERGFWFGKKHAAVLNGKPVRFTSGIKDQIVSLAANNITTFAGPIGMDEFEAELLKVFAYGSSEKLMFGGNKALSVLNAVVRKSTSYQVFPNEKEFGMRVIRFITPFGELVFKSHPLFTQSAGGTTAAVDYNGLTASAAILDMANISYVHLTGDDLRYEPDLTAVGLDGMKSGYIAECGLELHHASTHHWWDNVAAATV